MKLYGFQCDNCGTKSRDKPGTWLEVKTMHMSSTSEWVTLDAVTSEGRHYCSKCCLAEFWQKYLGHAGLGKADAEHMETRK